jgi:hypothetical protein
MPVKAIYLSQCCATTITTMRIHNLDGCGMVFSVTMAENQMRIAFRMPLGDHLQQTWSSVDALDSKKSNPRSFETVPFCDSEV